MQIFNISPICLLFQLQCFLLFIHLIKMDYCLVKYSLVTLNGLINPSTIRSITLSHYKLNATQEPLPKLVIWDIYGPSMEKIWDELWSIYGIFYGLDMGYCLPYQTHTWSLFLLRSHSIVQSYGFATYFVKFHTSSI